MNKKDVELRPLIVDDEIDLIALWQRVKLGWYWIVGGAILLGILLGVVGFYLPEKYEVEGVISVPESWNLSSEVTLRIVNNYTQLEEYEDSSIEVKILNNKENSPYEVLLTQNVAEVNQGKENLRDLLKGLQMDADFNSVSEKSIGDLELELKTVEAQLEDAYEKKDKFNEIIGTKDTLYFQFNPLEMESLITELDGKKISLERNIEESRELSWSMSPSTDYENQQISTRILVVAGLFLGAGLGGIVALVKNWK